MSIWPTATACLVRTVPGRRIANMIGTQITSPQNVTARSGWGGIVLPKPSQATGAKWIATGRVKNHWIGKSRAKMRST